MIRFNLIGGCFLSFALHAGLFFLAPGLSFQFTPPPEAPTDAELVELDVPIPPTLQLPPPEQVPVLDDDSQAVPTIPTYDATKIAPPDMQRINGAIEKMSAGLSAQLPLPVLQLPTRSQLEQTALSVPPPALESPDLTLAMLEQSMLAPGLAAGRDKQIGWGQVRIGEKKRPSRLGLPKLDQQLISRAVPTAPPVSVPPLPLQQRFGIQGPAAKREPLYRPSPPKVQVQVESDITLKFWVRPDGVVSRIVTERKGDTALEAAAIRYLEGWRFTPLPLHEPQVEQWGTLTVRFLFSER